MCRRHLISTTSDISSLDLPSDSKALIFSITPVPGMLHSPVLVFRLIGGIVVVSNHPQNFGEVTRIVGESIISVVLLVVLTTGTAICVISPAFVRIRAQANGRGELT